METHDLVQGSTEWLQFRLTKFGASEAAAMLGLSPKVKRNELLHMKYTGTPKEYSDWLEEVIFAEGHRTEALARPLIEDEIGTELYPVTCSDGQLSASCDGLTMNEEIAWEHKQYSEALFKSVKGGVLPEEHWPQTQQILMITKARRLKFTCSDGTEERKASMWVKPDEAWFERIHAGWAQFAKDLDAYEPRVLTEKPQAETIMGLPTLAVQIKGEVVHSNLPRFKEAADRFIANIKTDLQTDQDFANAEETVKACERAEKELDVAKKAAISQTASIDELLQTIDHIRAQLRDKRLSLDKLVTKRKAEIKDAILIDGRKKFSDHVKALEKELGGLLLMVPMPDFAAAAKNKRTLESLHESIDTALANGKISADAAALDVRTKLDWYRQNASDYEFLFRDLQNLIQKPADDFQLAVTSRIDVHKQQEEERRKREEAAAQQEASAGNADASAEAPCGSTASMGTGAAAAAADTRNGRAGTSPSALSQPGRASGKTAAQRPTDDQMIDVLALHYRVHESKVVEWLLAMDLEAASARLADAF